MSGEWFITICGLWIEEEKAADCRRISLPIYFPSGESVEAWTYIAVAPDDTQALKPYDWYKSFFIAGAREHGLPKDYITFLDNDKFEALEDQDANRKRSKLSLLAASPTG